MHFCMFSLKARSHCCPVSLLTLLTKQETIGWVPHGWCPQYVYVGCLHTGWALHLELLHRLFALRPQLFAYCSIACCTQYRNVELLLNLDPNNRWTWARGVLHWEGRLGFPQVVSCQGRILYNRITRFLINSYGELCCGSHTYTSINKHNEVPAHETLLTTPYTSNCTSE